MTMYHTAKATANHHPEIKLNGGPLIDYTDYRSKKVRYNLRTNPESDSQERQRIKRLLKVERKINRTLNICATLQCFFASCFLAIGLYLTIAKAWGYKSGANFIAAFFVLATGMAGYRAARSKLRTPIKWNCIAAWSVFTVVYIPIFLVGLLGAFLSLHQPYLDELQFPKDPMTLSVHGSNSVISMFGFLVTLIQATVKTNSRTLSGHYTKTVSPVVLTVSETRPSPPPSPPQRACITNHVSSNHLSVPGHLNATRPSFPDINHHQPSTSRALPTGGAASSASSLRTCSDITTRV